MNIDNFQIPVITQKRLLNAGYKTEQDFIGKTEDDIKSCGVGEKGLYDLKNFLKYEFKIKLIKVKKKIIDNSANCKLIIDYFLEGVQNINWGVEMKRANTLLKLYPLEFLLKLPVPKGIYSLGYFSMDFGKKYIEKHAPIKIVSRPSEEVENDTKIEVDNEEDAPYTKVEPPKTFKTFLGLSKRFGL